jgi:YbbR domain-containing protein
MMTKYLITLIVFLIAIILFLYSRSKKQNQIRVLKKDPRTGTFTDI